MKPGIGICIKFIRICNSKVKQRNKILITFDVVVVQWLAHFPNKQMTRVCVPFDCSSLNLRTMIKNNEKEALSKLILNNFFRFYFPPCQAIFDSNNAFIFYYLHMIICPLLLLLHMFLHVVVVVHSRERKRERQR